MSEIKKPFRVAILGIYHESNTFIDKTTELRDFENGHLLRGSVICDEYRRAFHEIGGMLEVLEANEIEILPVLFAEATPGGIISTLAYTSLADEMMERLESILPVDACLVAAHGAAVSEEFTDMDGHWLTMIRTRLGAETPIVGTLDPHANVSQLMVDSTTALIAYRTNPHIDQRETGIAAANLLMEILNKGCSPSQVLIQTPVAISIEQQNTSIEPCKSLYSYVSDSIRDQNVLSVSILLGFPYADVIEMGTSFIVITDNDRVNANAIGTKFKNYLLKNKTNYVGKKKQLQIQLNEIETYPKPVLLLDMGDNIGAGSMGNSTFLLEALEADERYKSFICIYDPTAVEISLLHPKGGQFPISFGINPDGGSPYTTELTLLEIFDGQFTEPLPRHGGQVNYDMGKVIIGTTPNKNTIMLISLRIPPFSLRQITAFGVRPTDFDVIVAKGVIAPIAAYGPVCPTIVQIDTPGVTQSDMTRFDFKNRRKPLFPFEADLAL